MTYYLNINGREYPVQDGGPDPRVIVTSDRSYLAEFERIRELMKLRPDLITIERHHEQRSRETDSHPITG